MRIYYSRERRKEKKGYQNGENYPLALEEDSDVYMTNERGGGAESECIDSI